MVEYIKKLIERRLVGSISAQLESVWLRKRFNEKYSIDVGMYTYGVFDPVRINPNVKFGRYCSVADTVRIFRRNHGVASLSTHPYFYNSSLGFLDKDLFEFAPLSISDDVWIGSNVSILPSVNSIGRGAVIGAGSIVTHDIPPYAIVAGNPSKLIRYRFSSEIMNLVEKSGWWLLDKNMALSLFRKNPDVFLSPSLENITEFRD